jgi:hypothetical protein
LVVLAHGDDETPPDFELLLQRLRNLRRGGGHHDRVELGVAVGYEVTVVDTTERPPLEGGKIITALDDVALKRPAEAAIVVATHGVFDEDARRSR